METQTLVYLQSLTREMAPTLAHIANERAIWLQVRDRYPYPYHLEDALNFIAFVQEQTPALTFGIFYEEQLCGVIGLTPMTDVHRVSAEIGYWLGRAFWGKGIATEAVRQLVTYAFRTFPLERIFAGVFSSNPASMRVLEKAGFRLEGIALRSVIKNGQLLNEHQYALTRPEWSL